MARRRTEVEQAPPLTFGQRRHLKCGFSLDRELLKNDLDGAKARALWEVHADELVADWVRRRPGTRPWAWWRFDAPEDREVRGVRCPPHAWFAGLGNLHVATIDWHRLESEPAYLRRHRLLNEDEAARLGPEAYVDVWLPESARVGRWWERHPWERLVGDERPHRLSLDPSRLA